MRFCVSSRNQRSTRLSQEEDVGMTVKVEAGVLREPLLHLLMLMRGVVVHDQMQLQRRWRFAIDLA